MLFAIIRILVIPVLYLLCSKYATKRGEVKGNLKVRCGEWDTKNATEPAEHQDRNVKTIKVHPGFGSNLTNNIALLFVDEDFVLSAHIDIICLPNLQDMQNSYQKSACFATGWGKNEFGQEGEYQVIMKQVQMDLVPPYECQEALRGTRLGRRFNLDPTALCAGGAAGADTCKGDGGGPLVCHNGENNGYGPQYVQAGIIGWGIGCGQTGLPGVYTDVADMLCFIDFSTRCVNEDEDVYGITGCRNWAVQERNRIQTAADAYEYQANLAQGRIKRKLERRFKQHDRAAKKYDNAIQTCGFQVDDDLSDDYDEVDLNGYQRTGASIADKTEILQSDQEP